MTNALSILLALAIAVAIVADGWFNGWTGSLFLARKLAAFIEYLAFWR